MRYLLAETSALALNNVVPQLQVKYYGPFLVFMCALLEVAIVSHLMVTAHAFQMILIISLAGCCRGMTVAGKTMARFAYFNVCEL